MGKETFQESEQKKTLVGRKEAPGMLGGKALQSVKSGSQKQNPAYLCPVCHRVRRTGSWGLDR